MGESRPRASAGPHDRVLLFPADNGMAIPNLLFVDANIWLDFYRVRNDTGLRLLEHTEDLANKLIVT